MSNVQCPLRKVEGNAISRFLCTDPLPDRDLSDGNEDLAAKLNLGYEDFGHWTLDILEPGPLPALNSSTPQGLDYFRGLAA